MQTHRGKSFATDSCRKGKTMRLIDADALIDELGISDEDIVFEEMLEDAPTIDAVQVIRCKDCKWFNRFGCAIEMVDFTDRPTENDFCSFGERERDD